MNTPAVLVGLGLGVATAVVCYVVSMITSGLFGRSFYRLYARVLVGTCSVMLLAPALRWLAMSHPGWVTYGLAATQYVVVGLLFYGVYRFNRDHLKRLYFERKTATFFAFGTLAYAAVVTLVFLHVSITGAPSWNESEQGYLGAGNYGPLLIILASMIFYTDYCLKQANGDQRRFSRFSFLGYACSFVGLALSMVPYVGGILSDFKLAAFDDPLLQNFFSAQALLFAIILYGWLVAKYESIPPLYLLLLAIVAEYHVLVTQWFIRSFGAESWGLASLPLFAGLVALDHYFSRWDRRKHPVEDDVRERHDPSGRQLRFYVPFRLFEIGMAIALLIISLWARFLDEAVGTDKWLVLTFCVYACFFAGTAVVRSEPRLFYVSGLLASLAVLIGFDPVGGPLSTVLMGLLSNIWSVIALLGERGRLKLSYRTPLVDIALFGAVVTTLAVMCRHLIGPNAYHFQVVGLLDALGLALAAAAFLLCAFHYRSKLPVFGAIAAVSAIVPLWCAAVGLLATSSAWICKRSMQKENAFVLEDRCSLFGTIKLPMQGVLPELFVHPLSMGAIPLAFLGLLISVGHALDGNFSATVMVGAVLSAVVLAWLARTYKNIWLSVSSFLAAYFAIHTVAHGLVLRHWPVSEARAGHWLVAATTTLIAWLIATGYAAWCNARLRRAAEDQEAVFRRKRADGAGLLYDMAAAAAVAILVGIFAAWISREESSTLASILIFVAMFMVTGLFCHSAFIYRSQIGSYLALTAATLTVAQSPIILDLAEWEMSAIAGVGLFAAVASFFACGQRAPVAKRSDASLGWKRTLPYLQATGFDLWFRPLGLYGMICSAIAVLAELGFDEQSRSVEFSLSVATPLTLAIAGAAYLFSTRAFRLAPTYLVGIALIVASVHALIAVQMEPVVDSIRLRYVQLFTAASLSLIGCCIAAGCAGRINTRKLVSDVDNKAKWLELRAYYSGLLQHVSLGIASVTLLCFIPAVVIGEVVNSEHLWLNVGTCLLVAVTFALLGRLYCSRVQTYAALTSVLLGVLSFVSITMESSAREYWILTIAAIGLTFVMIALAIQRRAEGRRHQVIEYGTRRFDCWDKPPWPWVSMESSLWSVPLAQFALLMSMLTVGLVGYVLLSGDMLTFRWWQLVVPVYLSSATFFVTTRMHDVGLAALLVPREKSSEANAPHRLVNQRAERSISFVACLVLLASAVHLTLQLRFVSAQPNEMAFSWHLMVGSLLTLAGWAIATVCVKLFSVHKSDSNTLGREDDLVVYGGMLHHVSVCGTTLLFAAALLFGVPPSFVSIPAMIGLGLLTLAFILNSVTYRSQFTAYLALLTAGLTTVHAASWLTVWSPSLAPVHAPSIALLGLGLMLLARLAFSQSGGQPNTREAPLAEGIQAEQPVTELRPWLETNSWRLDGLYSTWTRPLREFSLLYAMTGLVVMLLHRWLWNDTWNVANSQALVTYGCVAITFALGAKLYDSPWLSYLSAMVVAFSAVPQMLILGVPVTHLGAGLAAAALGFWVAGYLCERVSTALTDSGDGEKAQSIERVYERPLIRSSAILAVVAIVHSLWVWKAYGWTASQFPMVFACALGSITLLLNARSLNVLHRVTRARTLVYLACVSVTGCSLAVSSAATSFDGLGPVSAVTALVLGVVALVLTERSRAVAELDNSLAESRLTFGEPISHSAALLATLAVVVSLVAIAGSMGTPIDWMQSSDRFALLSQVPLLPAAITILTSSVVFLLTVRTEREMRWLYPFAVLGSLGFLLLAQSQLDWDGGTLVLASLGLMNVLVCLARLIRAAQKPVESLLGLSDANCDAPFFQWPLLFATGMLMIQATLATYGAFDASAASQSWPWLWGSLLVGAIFLHVLSFEGNPACVHLVVWAAVTGAIGFYAAEDLMLSRDELVVAVGFGWGAMAVGFLAGSRAGRDPDGVQGPPMFSGAGNSLLTLLYLIGSGVAIAPVALTSQAIAVGIALGCISLCWLWMSWVSGEEVLGFATVLGLFATVLYVAHGVLGESLFGNPFTAFFVVGYSFLLYGANILISRAEESNFQVFLRPTYYLALALPLSLAVAIPIDQRAAAALALLAAGAFYLLVARQSQVQWALYVAAACANVAIYIWIPVAQEATGLFQLYVIPAAITVLIFAQLHRHELNAQVLTSIRLAAAGLILSVSTYEVFFAKDAGLMQFVLVLLLSLAGTAMGIALRIKPFVYVGVTFLVVNVLGQLGIQFQHQGGVIRAVILIGLGLLILAMMIFFNVHRERIVHSYRGFLADKSWE